MRTANRVMTQIYRHSVTQRAMRKTNKLTDRRPLRLNRQTDFTVQTETQTERCSDRDRQVGREKDWQR